MRTVVLLCTLALASGVAHAAPDPVVLAIDKTDIYVDLGARDGVGAGSELELLHEVSVRDPQTGKPLRDRFALGTLTVTKSGAGVSVATAPADLAKRILVGDHVRLVSAKRTFVDAWTTQEPPQVATAPTTPPPATTPNAPAIDHAGLAKTAWLETLGKPLEDRVARWQALVKADPQTPYRAAIETEIASLRRQAADREAALERAKAPTATRGPSIAELVGALQTEERTPIVAGPIANAVPHQPLDLAFVARGKAAGGNLFVRPAGAPGWTRIRLAIDGDAYLRATIPAALVVEGELAYYVEVNETDVYGSAEAPRTIVVEESATEGPVELGRTHMDGHVDYVDFDGNLDNGYDQYVTAELDFGYRFLTPVYAVHLGFGTLAGTGGPKDVIDADTSNSCRDESNTYRCRRVVFSYVYTELEFKIRPNVALMVRPQAGLLTTDTMDTGTNRCGSSSDIAGCEYATPFGLRGRLRLGAETGTNLVLGASFTDHVGTLVEAAYNWRPHPVVPVQITVQVTDQPVVQDLGVRLIADVGWRKVPWFYPSARASYQARDIDHSGFSGGFALNFDW